MGEIVVDAELENPIDRGVFERRYGKESDIRRTSVRAVVDTGAVMLMLGLAAPVKRLIEQFARTHFLDARINGARARRA